MARKTRSAFSSNSDPSISCIFIWPVASSLTHSTRAQTSFLSLPLSPLKHLVVIAQSRSQPSRCDDDVRNLAGQYGQVNALFSCSGGRGISSICVTDAAPCRLLVPTQSDPVSPPPITMTCLPAAEI